MRDKIDRTIDRALTEVEMLEKLFANNGAFENAVAEIGGDISWFGDVRENLKQLFSNIEELHMGAVAHLDEGKMSDQHWADKKPGQDDNEEVEELEEYIRKNKFSKMTSTSKSNTKGVERFAIINDNDDIEVYNSKTKRLIRKVRMSNHQSAIQRLKKANYKSSLDTFKGYQMWYMSTEGGVRFSDVDRELEESTQIDEISRDMADEYYEASIGAPDYNPAAGKYTDNMVEKVFLNAEDGGIKVTVNDEEVGYASEPKELAQILGSLGVDENTSIMHSSDVDFASEEGFETDGAAHEFIDAALEMMGINENKDLAVLRKLAGI